jgi:hypothetical protein
MAASAAATARRTDWSVRGTDLSNSRNDMPSSSSTLRPIAREKRADTFWKASLALVRHSQSASLLSNSRSSRLTVSCRSSSAKSRHLRCMKARPFSITMASIAKV